MTAASGSRSARIAVLASGGGSNFGAILEYLDSLGARAAGRVVLAASDRAGAHALDRARARNITAVHLGDPTAGAVIEALLREADVDLIVLAGYLRLVPPQVIRRWRGRIINVHPALLPSFGGPGMYGVRAHRAVIASGARLTGPSVHFVDEEYDRGPIIAQWPVPVLHSDTPESLAARVLRVEHLLYPRVVDAVAGGRIRLGPDDRVHYQGDTIDDGATFTLTPAEADTVARSIDLALG